MNILKLQAIVYLFVFLTAMLPSQSIAAENTTKYQEKIEEYRENLQEAVEDKDIDEIKKLIDFSQLYNIKKVVNPDMEAGKPLRLEYDFSKYTIKSTPDDILKEAEYIASRLKSIDAVTGKNTFFIVKKIRFS